MTGTLTRTERKNPLKSIGVFFKNVALDFIQGDIFVKLSALVMGAGFFRRKQIINGVLMTLFQAVIIYFTGAVTIHYLSKFGTLGTVERELIRYNTITMQNEYNNFDNSFQILLFSIISIIILTAAFIIFLNNIRTVRSLEVLAKEGGKIPSFIENLRTFREERFHITLLTVPCIGIVLFTIVPLIVMITVAFTNYDQQHMVPANLFTWVGIDNFKALFSGGVSSSFSYAFGIILSWTLTWAVAATFTNYFLGIGLASLINNKHTRLKRMWRTMFIVTIAVPQFVTLLLIRNFFATTGIVNNIAAEWGVTEFLRNIGMIPAGATSIPFLTDIKWARTMVILINIWIGVPFTMLIATGVLMNIPKDLYESARIDGAGPIRQFTSITMPYMFFVTAPFLVTQVVHNINNFNVIYLLTDNV